MVGWADPTRKRYVIRRAYMRTSPTEKARRAVAQAVKTGRLVRPDSCSECGQLAKVPGHHEDYWRLLVVQWLCPTCHAARRS